MSNTMAQYVDRIMEHADPRVEDYFMMSSILPSLIITVLYFYVVKVAGPKFMENRKAYDIRSTMIVYNFAMVVLSGYICWEFAAAGWFNGYSLSCQVVDYSDSPNAIRMVNACYLFYISKFIELLDTVFFILRKKDNQVSFLHVFHHGIMPISWWFGVKFVPGGFGTFHAFLNSFVHFVMYMYYGIAALGPQYQKYLWWKKYMTKIQITQFILVMIHSSQLIFMADCGYPKLFIIWILLYAFIFLIMFANFYKKSYKRSHAKKDGQNELKDGQKATSIANGTKQE